MDNKYLIPANIKRGQLILNLFLPADLVILGVGIVLTVILLLLLDNVDVASWIKFLSLIPAFVSIGLVFPVPNYHNVRTFISEIVAFYSNNRNYRWRGWCVMYESNRK